MKFTDGQSLEYPLKCSQLLLNLSVSVFHRQRIHANIDFSFLVTTFSEQFSNNDCQSQKQVISYYTSNTFLRILRRTRRIYSSSSSRWTGTSGFLHRRCRPKTDCNNTFQLFLLFGAKKTIYDTKFKVQKKLIGST